MTRLGQFVGAVFFLLESRYVSFFVALSVSALFQAAMAPRAVSLFLGVRFLSPPVQALPVSALFRAAMAPRAVFLRWLVRLLCLRGGIVVCSALFGRPLLSQMPCLLRCSCCSSNKCSSSE